MTKEFVINTTSLIHYTVKTLKTLIVATILYLQPFI